MTKLIGIVANYERRSSVGTSYSVRLWTSESNSGYLSVASAVCIDFTMSLALVSVKVSTS
jgi:hypothetical protein